jgi:hypothetical protein
VHIHACMCTHTLSTGQITSFVLGSSLQADSHYLLSMSLHCSQEPTTGPCPEPVEQLFPNLQLYHNILNYAVTENSI